VSVTFVRALHASAARIRPVGILSSSVIRRDNSGTIIRYRHHRTFSSEHLENRCERLVFKAIYPGNDELDELVGLQCPPRLPKVCNDTRCYALSLSIGFTDRRFDRDGLAHPRIAGYKSCQAYTSTLSRKTPRYFRHAAAALRAAIYVAWMAHNKSIRARRRALSIA